MQAPGSCPSAYSEQKRPPAEALELWDRPDAWLPGVAAPARAAGPFTPAASAHHVLSELGGYGLLCSCQAGLT